MANWDNRDSKNMTARILLTALLSLLVLAFSQPLAGQQEPAPAVVAEVKPTPEERSFRRKIEPLLAKYCLRCHNMEEMQSGIRFDHLTGGMPDNRLRLWKGMQDQIGELVMPPEDEPQPTDREREFFTRWIGDAVNSALARDTARNGSIRRLTVSQYRNTLKQLLGLEEVVTDVLPPDAVSRDGFVNNEQTLLLSPLLVESYFSIAEKALDLTIVDESSRPSIQNFRMDLGAGINPKPYPGNLILGALSTLLANDDFLVSELQAKKSFGFEPFMMQTRFRFIEGYEGNATVRGWREFDSIYHAVFACMRGNDGYPKGLAYEVLPAGLVLRPAIPSAEQFQVESTYGPKANFKISLRELPEQGNFRVRVRAAKYDDGLLLNPGIGIQVEPADEAITINDPAEAKTVMITQAGIYQADVHLQSSAVASTSADDSRLTDALLGHWPFNGNTEGDPEREELTGQLEGGARLVDSPFGQALSLDGNDDSLAVKRDDSMNVGSGEYTVTAWIHPRELRQGGIVCLGKYNWTHGWYFDMPNNQGVLRIETVSPANKSNGTVASRPGVIRVNQWQHVAAVVRRAPNLTRLYVNGYQVATGSVAATNLDNPSVRLHIGRIQDSKLFKGEIDEVRLYRRALDDAEIQALLLPGKEFIQPPPPEQPQQLTLKLGDRHFSARLQQAAFLAVRLPAGQLDVETLYGGATRVQRLVLSPLADSNDVAQQFTRFESRSPQIGVHLGLRRDCGTTMSPVGSPQPVSSTELQEYTFEGSVNNHPSPDVEKDNVNYLAGMRDMGVRSEYTDGRDMPRLLIQSIEFEGPYYEQWPPAAHRTIFIDSDNRDRPAVYAREIIRSFATRAFRRPISAAEEDAIFSSWQGSFTETGDFQQSIKDSLLVVLTAPQFLFLIENSATPDPEVLDSYELASKLSYFLWNEAPDQQLLDHAAAGTLHDAVDDEISRMVQDPRLEQFMNEFTSQWLSLDKFDVVEVDRKKYPTLTRDTRLHLRQEPVQFLQYLVRQDMPLANLVQSDFVMANEVVASYYGLADRAESGFQFLPIEHENANLGGLLSQASILAGLSNGRESNPVKRGAWLARKIIAEPPDDPPPNVPDLDEDTSQLSLRERLEVHRNQPGCAKCHAGIDPWGLPFETFDAGGLFKKNVQVEANSTLPDGTDIKDLNALKDYLANDRIDKVAFSFLKHMASYAVGRSLSYNELVLLEEQGRELGKDGYRIQQMIRFIINSDLFLTK
jgi:hypothetical protein